MAAAGDAFKSRQYPCHVFVILTTPDEEGQAVIVNLTDRENDDDRTCELQVEDYPEYITKPTIVLYRKGGIGNAGPFLGAGWQRMPPVLAATLRKIQEGALKTPAFAPRFKEVVQRELGVP